MLTLLARRLIFMAATMLAASLLLFLLFELLPGDVATSALGAYATEEQRRVWLTLNGYDRPATLRYLDWLARFVAGDWGASRLLRGPVTAIVLDRLANTAILAACFFAVLTPLALALGILAGMNERSPLDRIVSAICILTASIPPFASTVLLSAILVFGLHWLPGTSSGIDGFDWKELVMPVLVLVLYDFGYVARITRTAMAETMTAPYIRQATLRGLPRHRVVLRHALRNALVAPVTVLLLHVNWLVSGVIVVEYFFAYKGFGSLILEASLGRDLFLLEACTMVTVAIAVISQSLSDIAYVWLNPRLRA